jgi:hypothetical protein
MVRIRLFALTKGKLFINNNAKLWLFIMIFLSRGKQIEHNEKTLVNKYKKFNENNNLLIIFRNWGSGTFPYIGVVKLSKNH